MGKKDKKSKKEPETMKLNSTSKFTVLDAPGISQSIETSATAGPDSSSASKANKDGQQGRRTLAGSGPKISTGASQNFIGANSFSKRTANQPWIKSRSEQFDEIATKRAAEFASKKQVPISVTMPDGNVLTVDKKKDEQFMAWKTSPVDVAASISQGLADASVVARVTYADVVDDYDWSQDGMEGQDTLEDAMTDGGVDIVGGDDDDGLDGKKKMVHLWDMTRPLVGNVAKMEFLKFDDDADAKTVFWHSSAHMLGEALENLYGCRLTIGPPLAGGFYYDSYMGTDAFKEEDYKPVEKAVQKIAKQKQKFQRLVVTKDEALSLFAGNPFKEQIISTKVPDNTRTTVYKCGDLIDLCRGPHVPHTGKVKAFAAIRHSATNWLGDTENDSLQRMYGVSFPDKKQLKAWQENQAKAKERDHRRIGIAQNLFMFHDLSPGSAFFLPHGTRIHNALVNFIKGHYWKRGYQEVITPNIYNLDLWHQSGHALHYKDAMFSFDVEKQEFAMKPMNCPGHCLIFASQIRSYRDLPIRIADFGVLHRNELSGALTGLTRVRRFQQDDAHIFCREDQIESEVLGSLEFMKSVYTTFGMTYKLELSTKPDKALGDPELWVRAEKALENAMNDFAGKGNWKVNPKDGAFYGPKIDIKVMDAMERVHQCATIQLDFQLPIRFNLEYNTGAKDKGEAAFQRPVMVHRAMLGSVERMFAVLCEHYGGKWPLWLSPRQMMVVPVHADWGPYCEKVRQLLHDEGFFADVDVSKATFPKKVRNAQVAQYNFILVVGEAEVNNNSVNIRTRDNKVEGEMKLDDMIKRFKDMREQYQ
eukprot:CAMPEP_0195518760 /NCGR_PEP_ID=MMETSP0794_2-20130614/13612_1 /TAXON_ID=515487 /ORGANISM="Stephanopyxis turris, Strain CCMP 815" /LENGTH=815 /DNA_ID=CAMNT_0040647781 /DNA_START=100 /DNA_END=2547 /DNA_ORIENTATION=+